jgi:hypothetical protein
MSEPVKVDFTLVRGDSKDIYLGIGRDGTRINLTGGQVSGMARENEDAATAALTFVCTLANQTTDPGGVLCHISKAESALVTATKLVYDIQVDFPNGIDRQTPVAGTITMKKDNTRA